MYWDRDNLRPLVTAIGFVWDEVFAAYYPARPEVWLNPEDWEELGRPPDYMDAPVKTSIGIPRGTARIFDRETLRYLPPAGLAVLVTGVSVISRPSRLW